MRFKKELVCLLLWLLNASAFAYIEPPEELSDWIIEPSSTSLCKGHYIESAMPYLPITNDWDLPLKITANESEFSFEGQSTLTGKVSVQQGTRILEADKIIVERTDTQDWKRILAKGHIHYFSPGMNIWGKDAEYNYQTKTVHIDKASYRWYPRHARGWAEFIDIDENKNVHLKEAYYTTCAPTNHTWILSAKDLTLNPTKGRAVAKHIRLDLQNIPIFYFPYFNYPIDNKRHSGFLFPSYGSTSNSGYEFTLPYYWNIAPNYDFTLAAKWLTERGLETQSKFRYLSPNSEGVVQWHFLPDDNKYGQFCAENLESPPGGLAPDDPRIVALKGTDSRYAINYRHVTRWDKNWQFNVVFDYVSDNNYLVDLGNDIHTASVVDLPQKANLSYYGENWTHVFNVEEYQVLQPLSKPINAEIYKRQPQWVFQGVYPNLYGFVVGLNGEIVNFTHRDDLITDKPLTTGQRVNARPSLSFPFLEPWYFIIPRVQFDWLYYSLKLGEDEAALFHSSPNLDYNPSRTIPLYDIDAGLIFERDINIGKFPFINTLEPRAYYLYVPFRDQHTYPDFDSGIMNFSYSQLFRDNRFSGRDRISDANQISLSLTSRLLPRAGPKEWMRTSIGQIFYFSNRRVSLCEELGVDNICFLVSDTSGHARHSNLIAQSDLFPSQFWSGGLFWEWDSTHQVTEQASGYVQYNLNPQKIINMNYYWQKHDIAQMDAETGEVGSLHQADISIFWPVTIHWQGLGRWHYDLKQRQTIEILAGIEYNGCCMALQLVGSLYRQSTNSFYPDKFARGIFAQIVFKGLSAIGLNNADGRLKQKIPGYLPLYNRQQKLTNPNPSNSKQLLPNKDIPLS